MPKSVVDRGGDRVGVSARRRILTGRQESINRKCLRGAVTGARDCVSSNGLTPVDCVATILGQSVAKRSSAGSSHFARGHRRASRYSGIQTNVIWRRVRARDLHGCGRGYLNAGVGTKG